MNRFLIAVGLVCASLASTGHATFTNFIVLPGGGVVGGNTFTATNSLVADGVSFDVSYTVTGTAAALTEGPLGRTGLGVSGGATNEINVGEGLTFLATISNVAAGATVSGVFDEVQLVDSAFTTTAQSITTTPITATVFAGSWVNPPTPGGNFYANLFGATFTGTPSAVPEPSSFAVLGFLAVGLVARRRRRAKV